MKIKVMCIAIIFFIFPGLVFAQTVNDIKFMTEEYPPYNFKNNGKLQGIAVDTLVLMLKNLKAATTRSDIQILPWARGYKKVLKTKNTCLFSTTRTKEREKLFKWVGPIGINKVVLTARKFPNIKIKSINDLKNYKIGVIRDDVAEQILKNLNVKLKPIEEVSNIIQNIDKLNTNKIQLFGLGENVAKWEIKKNGYNPNDYETVWVLAKSELYYAFYKETPEDLIKKFQNALEKTKKQKNYKKVLNKYLN